MNTEIFSLNGYNNICNGYATLKRSADSVTVGFSFKKLQRPLLCLYCDSELHLCGTLTPSRPYLEITLDANGSSHSFGVFDRSNCIAFNGSSAAFDKMTSFVSSKLGCDPPSPKPDTSANNSAKHCNAKPSGTDPSHLMPDVCKPTHAPTYFDKNKNFFTSIIDSSQHIHSLELLMPWSQWVTAPEGYILGIIYDHLHHPLYVCYGMQGKKDQRVPEELERYCCWLSGSDNSGWWIIYQDPVNGEALAIK